MARYIVPRVVPVATVSKHGKGWRVQIRRLGHPPISRTFSPPLTKAQAWSWSEKTEREVLLGNTPTRHTLLEAFERYDRDESPKKRGCRWEQYRLRSDAFRKAPQAARALSSLTAADLSSWRDARLRSVSGSTVRREMNLIESVLEVARREWKWLQVNPIKDVTKPAQPRSRRRRVPDSDSRAVCAKLVGPSGLEVAAGFRLAIETGMRAGELWSLERSQIDLDKRVARLLKTKNGDERDVPLSKMAVKIIRGLLKDGRETLFTVSNASRDVLFRRARDAAGVVNLHFHDSRAEAVWRLSKKFDPFELGRVIGHRDPKSLYFYYEADAAELASKLD